MRSIVWWAAACTLIAFVTFAVAAFGGAPASSPARAAAFAATCSFLFLCNKACRR